MTSCTTILVGKKASYDGSTMIARNDDCPNGMFILRNLAINDPNKMQKTYTSKIAKITIDPADLPDNPLKHSYIPLVSQPGILEGVWGAAGINSKNVAVSATETITTNERVLGGDPLIDLRKNEGKYGLGEEDFVSLILPYINSAREGIKRLGMLLEKYGTYESNGIAISDENEVWWLETIGGHHFIAKKVPDDKVVIMPNRFGLDTFDLEDAFGKQENHICSADLREFIKNNKLKLNKEENVFNPRLAFGSHTDFDHIYDTPRHWFLGRYLCKKQYKWDGPNADFNPESDDIPWAVTPDNLVTVEDIKYLLSSHFQGTKFDPYSKGNENTKHKYRVIGIQRTGLLHCCQIRGYMPNDLKSIMWFTFGANTFNTFVPLYNNVNKIPTYFCNTSDKVDTNSFYWQNRLIGALADSQFNSCIAHIERYQLGTVGEAYNILNKCDKEYKDNNVEMLEKANQEIADMIKEKTDFTLDKVLYEVSMKMKTAFNRNDN